MTRLNQIIAVEAGVKSRTYADLTAADKTLKRADALAGISRSYRPIDDEGEALPSEHKIVQVRVDDVLEETAKKLTRLEKQLTDLHTMVGRLPVLDPSEIWHFSPEQNAYVTEPRESTRTKKIMRAHVLYEATDKHPAQVNPFTEDEVVGYWTTEKLSGAAPAGRRAELLRKVEALQEAVKFAREQANSLEVTDVEIGAKVFGYLFA